MRFVSNIDCVSKHLRNLNAQWYQANPLNNNSPIAGDLVAVYSDSKCEIRMVVERRVWRGTTLEVELGINYGQFRTIGDMEKWITKMGIGLY